MTFQEALKIPKELEANERHREKYQLIVQALGYEDVKKCIPFTLKQLKKAYCTDTYFNNLPIRNWDYAAGFIASGARCEFVGSSLTRLYKLRCNVDTFSLATGVCILKECARMWCEEELEAGVDNV